MGISDREDINFDAFFRQNYPGPVQLLFSVSTEDDPVIPVVRELMKKYPAVDAEVVISRTRKASSKKFDALYDAQVRAKHGIVIWSDADAIVEIDYVSQMAAALQDPNVGIVTSPQFDTGMNGFATALKGIANNADMVTIVMNYYAFKRVKMGAWGHSLGFRKADFEALGSKAWDTINTFLVDDQALPYLFHQQGKRTCWKNIFCPAQWSDKSLKQVIDQKKSWVVFQQAAIGNRYLFQLGVFQYPLFLATLLLPWLGFSSAAWSLWTGVFGIRILASLAGELLYLRSVKMTLKYFWTIPIWDCIQIYFFILAFRTHSIRRHGKNYRIVDRYFLREVTE